MSVSLITRPPAVAGTFYPGDPESLAAMVAALLGAAEVPVPSGDEHPRRLPPVGLLVPHAGLVYSGVVAATAWLRLREAVATPAGLSVAQTTVVVLGTNHGAGWLDGIGAWDDGLWRTPIGDLPVDADLAAEIVGLGRPFLVDRRAHLGEHSIEVQLPILHAVSPGAAIVPLAVAAGTGARATDAGARLGTVLAGRRRRGERVILAISTDMAHYPAHRDAARVTAELLPAILGLEPEELAQRERSLVQAGTPGLACGMCGIEPAVVGLAALRAAGVSGARELAQATSADAGGPLDRTVGYLAVEFQAA